MPETPTAPRNEVESLHFSKRTKRITGALAGAAFLVAGMKYGPELWDTFSDSRQESAIVAGVPVQIESYASDSRVVGGLPYLRTSDYWLGVEQCVADVRAAEQGRLTTSFNPEIGAVNEGCVTDWVSVTPETFSSAKIGATFQFQGEVGEHLKK